MLSAAGLDQESASRAEQLHKSDQGWQRSGTGWKAQRGNVGFAKRGFNGATPKSLETGRQRNNFVAAAFLHTLPHRRAHTSATYIGRDEVARPLDRDDIVDEDSPTRSREEILPGDFVYQDGGWHVVLPSMYRFEEPGMIWLLSNLGRIQAVPAGVTSVRIPGVIQARHELLTRAVINLEEGELLVASQASRATPAEALTLLSALATEEATAARVSVAAVLRAILRQCTTKMESYRPHLFAMIGDNHSQLLARSEIQVGSLAARLEELAAGASERLQDSFKLSSKSCKNLTDPEQFHAQHASVMATFSLLLASPSYFVIEGSLRSFRNSQTFAVRPARERQVLQEVNDWITSDDRRVTLFKNEVEKNNGSPFDQTAWSQSSLTILAFLIDSLSDSVAAQEHVYESGVAYLLKSLNQVDPLPVGRLQEEGPNNAVADYDWGFLPKQTFRYLTGKLLADLNVFGDSADIDWSLTRGQSRRFIERRLTKGLKSSDFVDRGDLDERLRSSYQGTVWVIDDPGAHELDDGISIDPADEQGRHWLHAHIADPTSSLLPDDRLAVNAAEQCSTLYLTQGHLPLFPTGSLEGIAAKGKEKSSGRSLTFSALVNRQGQVEATNVGVRRLSDVQTITYDQVNYRLSSDENKSEDLTQLAEVAKALRQQRQRDGAISFSSGGGADGSAPLILETRARKPETWMLPSGLTVLEPSSVIPAMNEGRDVADEDDPAEQSNEDNSPIQLNRLEINSRDIVAECMIMAGRVAADFLWRSNAAGEQLPTAYRTQTLSSDVEAEWQKILQARGGGGEAINSSLDMSALLSRGIILPTAEYNATPSGHLAMGIHAHPASEDGTGCKLAGSGYARATSPLRRYEDLVTHWQIKSLLHRAAGQSGDSQRSSWTLEEMTEMVPDIQRHSERATSIMRSSDRFWAYKALREALKRRDATATATVDAIVTSPILTTHPTTLRSTCSILFPTLQARNGRPLRGDCLWPVELGSVATPGTTTTTSDDGTAADNQGTSPNSLSGESVSAAGGGGGVGVVDAMRQTVSNPPRLGQRLRVKVGHVDETYGAGGIIWASLADGGQQTSESG